MRSALLTAAALVAALPAAPLPSEAAAPARVATEVRRDVSPPLSDIPPVVAPASRDREIPNRVVDRPAHPVPPAIDPVLQDDAAVPGPGALATPPPLRSIEGMSADDNAPLTGFRFAPPDPQGDVGPSHYVQGINLTLAVHSKSTGARIFGPVLLNTLWSGFGGVCETENRGDPIVLYDAAAGRWLVSQFAFDSSFSGHQCIAVSTTGDPTGPYHRYAFLISPGLLNDYPKIGVWPDGYAMSVNEFDDLGHFYGVSTIAFERARMLDGLSAQMVKFGPIDCGGPFEPPAPECPFSLQPAHWEGGAPPPAGSPIPFVQAWDDETHGTGTLPDGYRMWELAVDWASPASSSFATRPQVDAPEFDSNLCNFSRNCIPQPSPGEALDALSKYTMYRLQYRNFGSHETLLVNHTVDASGADRAGIRWAELRKSGGGWTLHQTGTFAPADGLHRWNGSIAMDGEGHVALGYSVAAAGKHASIRYTSRAAGDPPGTLPGGEVELAAGSGVQQSSSGRWGDYSAMSVDPVDDCTFWYTQEYLTDSGQYDWKTRIGAFSLCGQGGGGCTPGESPETSCADGLDNDCDGLIDGGDPDCAPACTPTESPETSCTDGLDNDCDGLIDGADPDCPTCLPAGASCTANSQCCSNNCKGKAGAKTCK